MRRTFLSKTLSICCLLLASTAHLFAQQVDSKSAAALVRQNAAAVGLSVTDLQDFRVSNAYVDKISKLTLVYVQQTYKGIDVLNAIQPLAFKNGKPVSVAGGRIGDLAAVASSKDGKASVLPADAIRSAASHLNLPAPAAINVLKQLNEKKEIEYGNMEISSDNIRAKLIWVPVDEETQLLPVQQRKVFLCWQVTIQPKGRPDYWLVNVDALKGQVLNKINLNIACDWKNPRVPHDEFAHAAALRNTAATESNEPALVNRARYRVVAFPAESPWHPGGSPSVVQNPWTAAGAGDDATTLQWHDNGTTTFDSTRGNNVLAQEDVNGNNGNGRGARSTTAQPNLTFNFVPNFNNPPTETTNQNAGITNLFYANNVIHDLAYQYGFDAVSGNFQANNLGRGGSGNDFVFADAQDGSSSNNANFSTPSDGFSPRMQMFLWSGVPNLTVRKPNLFAGRKSAVESGFSTNNKLINVGPINNGRVVLYADDASNSTHLACGPAFNASQLAGRIALIDRGNCDFVAKVKNAQNAGAIAAIVVNNVPGQYPIIMGGTDNTITIPAVMVGFETGDSMKQVLALTPALTVGLAGGPNIDGDLDNGIIAHEYTHGISNRLTGNSVSCLGNLEQMGEGWSDYMALMLTTNWSTANLNDGPDKRPIGTYALGQSNDGPGIRFYPYSTNTNNNPWVYDSMRLSTRFSNNFLQYSPHAVGEVWCTMIWEMTWAIIQQTGNINANIYASGSNAGNTVALQLVMEGMKLQPCSPGFVDGRNAILRADTLLYGASHSAAIWQAFAKRGLGVNATQGSTNNIKDGFGDFSVPSLAIAAAAKSDVRTIPDLKFVISPNPAKDRISLQANGNTKALKVFIIDANGKQIKTADLKNNYLEISLPKTAPGVYYVKITGDGVSHTQKLIIQ